MNLWEHQSKYGDALLDFEYQALWWEMRTGKTLTAIHGSRDGDRLIICPNSVKGVWASDLDFYATHITGEPETTFIWNKKKRPDSRPRNVIVNYESLWRSPLLSYNFDTVIFDESHRTANFNCKLGIHIMEYLDYIKTSRRILLSGTPCPEGFHQIISQTLIAKGNFNGFTCPWEAIRSGWVYDQDLFKWKPNKGTNRWAKKILQSYSHSLTQEQVGINTKKLYRIISVPLSKREEKDWLQCLFSEKPTGARYGQLAQSHASGRDKDGNVRFSTKLEAVCEYVKENGRPAVVLAHYTSSLRYLSRRMSELGLTVALIDGQDGGTEYRGRALKWFNTGKVDVLVCQVQTVKVGLNLSHSDTLIFAENSSSGEARIQAEERCTVRGKEAVEIVDFTASSELDGIGQVDMAIRCCVKNKQDFNYRSAYKR